VTSSSKPSIASRKTWVRLVERRRRSTIRSKRTCVVLPLHSQAH
jgi:hypothetical protein